MYDQSNPEKEEVQPRDANEQRLLVMFGRAQGLIEIQKLREQQAKKTALKIPPILERQMWLETLEPERATIASRERLWPRINARDAGYRPYSLAQTFTEVLELARIGHCAAYRADYWWHHEYKLWLRDTRGNLMYRLFMQTFGDDIERWLNGDAAEEDDESRRFSLATVHQVIEIARRAPSIALTPADVDPSPPARLLDLAAMRAIPPQRSLLTYRSQRIIPGNATGVLVGDSETFKSYFAVKLAAAMGCGKRTLADFELDYDPNGWVVYIGAEDADGLAQRIAEACAQYGVDDPAAARILLWDQPVVMTDTEAVLDFIIQVQQRIPPDAPVNLVVPDTYNQSLGPDDSEDSADTARNFALNLRLLTRAFAGCTAMTVHHPPKSDLTGMRGSGALRHNTDFAFSFTRESDETTQIGVTCKKQKNSAKPAPFTLNFATGPEGVVLADVKSGAKVVEKPKPRYTADELNALQVVIEAGAPMRAGDWEAAAKERFNISRAVVNRARQKAVVDRYVIHTRDKKQWQVTPAGWEFAATQSGWEPRTYAYEPATVADRLA